MRNQNGDNNAMYKHGLTGSPTYISWDQMVARCTNPKHRLYHKYKGRLCEEWKDFRNFFADMGERPEGKTIDRIDNNGGYNKDNCRWATPKEQANNRSNNTTITYKGETKNICEWAAIIGIGRTTLKYRLDAGWSIEEAFTKPLHKNKKRK